MRRFLGILLLLFVSVWMGAKMSQDPGYVLFVYQQWSVTMPLWVAFLLEVFIILLLFSITQYSTNGKINHCELAILMLKELDIFSFSI